MYFEGDQPVSNKNEEKTHEKLPLFKMVSLCGVIRAWTIPVREGDGFTSVLSLSCCVDHLRVGHALEASASLSVTLELQEDHGGWSIGQHVVAFNVEFESPLRCATRFCVRSENEVVQQQQHVSFVDLPVHKIVGLNKRDVCLFVLLEGLEKPISCIDPTKCAHIVEIGVGGLVQLFNLKLGKDGTMCITERSGVRGVAEWPLPPSPPTLPPCSPLGASVTTPGKWQCLVCAHVNYPSKSVCSMCDHRRKSGPMFKDLRHYPLQKSTGKKQCTRR